MAAPPKLPLDLARAKVCLYSNLAVPGTGSWQAGWRVSGALQLVLATGGFLLSMAWGAWFLAEWARAGKLPMLVIYENEGHLPASYYKYLLVGCGGIGLFVLALGWAFITSLCIREEAKRNEGR